MTTRSASCQCGQFKVTCEEEPVRISICHCHACQKRTGSTFGVQARFKQEHVKMEGRMNRYERIGDAGGRVVFNFCPDCGSTVCFEIDKMPGFIAVPVGAFADSNFPPPSVSIYGARRHPWVATAGVSIQELD